MKNNVVIIMQLTIVAIFATGAIWLASEGKDGWASVH